MDRVIAPAAPVDWKSDEMAQRRKRRYAADRRLRIYGIVAISFALGFLAILIATLSFTGYRAFTQSVATVEIDLSQAEIDRGNLMDANWRGIFRDTLREQNPGLERSAERAVVGLFT